MPRFQTPDQEYSGYIFDLDGTLVDSMPLHYKAWRLALKEAGAPHEAFLPKEFYNSGGKSANDVVAYINETYHLDMDAKTVASDKRKRYLDLLREEGTNAIKEVIDFVHSIRKTKPIAIATGSALPGARATLQSAGIADLFDIIITPDDVQQGKPFPDMFLLAAERMNIAPGQCVVFEDAVPGMKAAEAAGMDCIVVKTPEEYFNE